MAVSRFTIIRSGAERPAAAGPKAVPGSSASLVAVRSAKWTSPAKPSVTVPSGSAGLDDAEVAEVAGVAAEPDEDRPEPETGAAAEIDGSVLAPVEPRDDGAGEPSHAASNSAAAAARAQRISAREFLGTALACTVELF
jgi:hypothetical protein